MKRKLLKVLLRPLYHSIFRLQLRARIWFDDRANSQLTRNHRALPPALLRYRVCETLSGDDFVRVGQGCARQVEGQIQLMGSSLENTERVLDFGCGCGRTLRWMMEAFPKTRFYGADVDAEAVEWCTMNLPGAVFVRSDPQPPLPYSDDFFDIIYCFSVFTHLDESMQDVWLLELRRVLKARGVLVITVHGERASGTLGPVDVNQFRRSGFVHRRTQKLKGIVPSWYNTSWHSRLYITDRLRPLFEDVRYTVVPDGIQDLVVAGASQK